MFGKSKGKKKRHIKIQKAGTVLYQGDWNDLPMEEAVILKKSREFFDDPSPCFIHREAVRVRLLSEMEEALQGRFEQPSPEWLMLLAHNIGKDIDGVYFYEE